MSDPLQTVYDALERAACDPVGPTHKATARCPVHEGRSRNLSLGEGADGRALLYCFTGCETHDITKALGLRWSDLFPAGHRQAPRIPGIGEPRRPIDLTLQALRKRGIEHCATRSLTMWVAAICPACGCDRDWPLWITEDESRLSMTCFNGCEQLAIVEELIGIGGTGS